MLAEVVVTVLVIDVVRVVPLVVTEVDVDVSEVVVDV